MGSYFGSSLCAVDLNGDGFSDLLVGAPMFSEIRDEGQVTVYINRGNVSTKLGRVGMSVWVGQGKHIGLHWVCNWAAWGRKEPGNIGAAEVCRLVWKVALRPGREDTLFLWW